ncbi:MAG: ABC transporter ATP-binding protein [Candidatus Scalindua sp.]|jgi:lipopolysaccharide transport system ATP-binding protein|nr:ABC transporter ATP-binding protein [Candidatus Scalindua sp.]MBT5305051.1 ABC transporter ATP-binding protein [Candidatus Scalindua sp.]MBT6228715.1 ABC transporter ATP-binding protein [Candidatus Scalindua sp.]MBT6563260.1 ABC transporter ATP-binding protein [Candidatus Scalindua sp.]MBT7210629.1 ABC transporter ATP-binding protein [Candidatus Scalindua sp.]
MNDISISVENLSKQYNISVGTGRGRTFREALIDKALMPYRRIKGAFVSDTSGLDADSESIWALKNISFQVKKGEVLGIIGRNGAGKTTLLKILSRITEPTEGEVRITGRVGSLLEVGAGFHSELTGRENVYLSGAILGMKKAEIDKKFDDMVAFAEIEKFINTPVKRYSSGMYMRLAFAVAVHLDPEILLVDEVLAVGDAVFQTKCLAKMTSITQQGRTVLFVSHNLNAVGSICRHGIVLDSGSIVFQGSIQESIQFYEEEIFQKKYVDKPIAHRKDRSGTGDVRLVDFHIENEYGEKIDRIRNGNTVKFCFSYCTKREQGANSVDLNIVVERETGKSVFQLGTRFTGQQIKHLPHKGQIVCTIKRFPLVPGKYKLNLYLESEMNVADYIIPLTYLDVIDGDFYGSGYQVFENESKILIDGKWSYISL